PYGESLAFGLVIEHDDGTESYAGHIPCNSSSNNNNDDRNGDNRSTGNEETTSSHINFGNITILQEGKHDRVRTPKPNEVSNTSLDDKLTDIEKSLIESYTTTINNITDLIRPSCTCTPSDLNNIADLNQDGELNDGCCPEAPDELNHPCNVCNGHKNADLVNKDISTAEEIGMKWVSTLADYIGGDGKDDLTLLFSPSKIKETALYLIDAVKRRERIELKEVIYKVTKEVSYTDNNNSRTNNRDGGVNLVTTYPNGEFISSGNTICKTESITYPCIRDCNGDLIYGDYTGTNITHHKFPDETELDYFFSNSIGVPSKLTPDADEYQDFYGIYLGAKFSNINIDKEDYYNKTGKKVCGYKIVQAKLNYSNKTILTKGLILSNYISSNQGKDYDYERHAVNSFETVNRYIDIDNNRIDKNANPSNTVCLYSLDQAVLQPLISEATKLKVVKRLSGIGYRH
ncbi:MAG: hypothetical protein KC414_01885, partial [Romboutsia sp.]|nr:hypothetical protein [Romboutsia sp.]